MIARWKREVELDDVGPGRVGGERRERGDGAAGLGRDGVGLDHQAGGLDLERGAQLEDVFDVGLGEDRHLDAAVGLAAQQAFADQDLGRGTEGVAGDAEALGEVVLAQAGARGELAVEDQVADRVGGASTVDTVAIRTQGDWGSQWFLACVGLFHNLTRWGNDDFTRDRADRP